MLYTPVKFAGIGARLPFDAAVASMGSCFAERMARYLEAGGLEVSCNPCGIVYNAVSLADVWRRLRDERQYREEDFQEHQGLWFSWEHHGSFSRRDPDEAVANANLALTGFRKHLTATRLVILTFSSSVVYELRENGRIVANCHKVPGNHFERRLLSYEENRLSIRTVLECVRGLAPEALVVLTLSPVRHYPGDLVLNSRSKANLLAAIHDEIDEKAVYFPAYEIMNDEMRDYRFYGEDMLHPSDLAARLICERFVEACFTAEALQRIQDVRRKYRHSMHRTLHE